ncbi:hypothetical protein [Diatraea saccharalis granulovirus]|uniref:Uncharacterized protein n=1 Tax=Diatraea saccharalis granulovirus TaxID=1675862 RepID=A0A0R7EYW8_9BBAC|nr:hypothetical protein [Diatraea saccharalis granulovirus]AKN80782.1 hypothetical protein [Diatraea saccharalis granulovirus]
MSTVHLFKCEYNDIYKFVWPVLIEYDELNLWLDVSSFVELTGFDNKLTTKKLSSFENVILHDDNDDNDSYQFCRVNVLYASTNDDNYRTVIEQFVFQQLPSFLNQHLNELKLVSLFSIKDFYNMLIEADSIRKYWLLRFKVVTMKYEKEKNFKCDSLINNVNVQFTNLNSFEDIDKLHALLSFNKMLKGSVGLLEVLLGW